MPIYSDMNQQQANKSNGSLVTDLAAIDQSIHNLLSTPIGSRIFNPLYGSAVTSLLFEIMSADTEFLLFNAIIDAVTQFEPRVTVDTQASTITADYVLQTYTVTLVMAIAGINQYNHRFVKQLKVI